MESIERKKLAEEMYSVANEIVGNVGPGVTGVFENGAIKSTPKTVALFCLHRDSPDYCEIMDTWKKWVTAYCVFKKHHNPEGAIVLDDPGLTIHWLKKPGVNIGSFPDTESYVLVNAYLNIGRIDCQPTF